jgi:LPS-assembly protein
MLAFARFMRRVGRFLWLSAMVAAWAMSVHADEPSATNMVTEPTTNPVIAPVTNTATEATTNVVVVPDTNVVVEPVTNSAIEPAATNTAIEAATNVVVAPVTNMVTEPTTNSVIAPATNAATEATTNVVVAPGTNGVTEPVTNPAIEPSATNAVTETVTNATVSPLIDVVAGGSTPIMHFDKMTFDNTTKMAVWEGNVVMQDKDVTLQADHIRYNRDTREAWAEGHVRMNQGAQEWVAPSMYYNFSTHSMKTDDVRGFVDPLYLHANHLVQVGTNHYVFTQGSITTSDYDQPGYHVDAKHGDIWTGDRMVLHDATMRLGNTPILWSPIVVWSLKGDMPPIAATVGEDSRWGFFLLSAFTWKLNRDAELTVHADERTDRGFGTGADLKYRLGNAGQGLLTGYYINDAQPNKADPALVIGDNRYRGEWQHKQYLTNDVTVTVDLNKLSDAEVMNDYFQHEFAGNREPDSVADVTKTGPDYTLSFMTRPQFNTFFAEVERLPEAKLAVDRTRLGNTPFFYEGESSVGEYHDVPGNTNVVGIGESPGFVGNSVRADTFHQIVWPSMLGGWLSVVPRAGVRGDYYSRAPDDGMVTDDVTRVVYDLGTEASFKISREWDDVHSDWLHLDGLRHILQPFADYQWVPRLSESTNQLFQFDSARSVTLLDGSQLSITRYSPLEFPAYNTIDSITSEDAVRFGLRQTLQTRRDDQAWNLVDVTGWTQYEIEKSPGETDFYDFFGTMELRPQAWLSLNAFARYDFQQEVLREFNTEARVVNADRWSLGLGTRYLRGDSDLFSVDLAYRLTRHWTAHLYERVDIEDHTWEEQEYTLRQETHDWFITYGFRYLTQLLEKDEMTVFFSVTLKAFPRSALGVN